MAMLGGQFLRARVWVPVKEPIRRYVKIDSFRKDETSNRKVVELYKLQYENLPYFCFSCGLLGHADIFCPTPARRDEEGKLPYSEDLRAPSWSRSWGNVSSATQEGSFASRSRDGQAQDEEQGEEVTYPVKNGGKVQNMVSQFNRGGHGRGYGRGGRGSGHMYRTVPMQSQGETLMLLDQDTLNKKRANELEGETERSGDSRDSKKKKASGGETSPILAAAETQPHQDQ